MTLIRNDPSDRNQRRRYSAVRPLEPNEYHSSSRSPAIAAWPAASSRVASGCEGGGVPGAVGAVRSGRCRGASGGAPATFARSVLVPERDVTRILAFEPLRRVASAAGIDFDLNVATLRVVVERLSESEPTFTDRGRVEAVNAFVEVTRTCRTNASPERSSAADALTAAPAVGARTNMASSAAQAASEDLMERS